MNAQPGLLHRCHQHVPVRGTRQFTSNPDPGFSYTYRMLHLQAQLCDCIANLVSITASISLRTVDIISEEGGMSSGRQSVLEQISSSSCLAMQFVLQ